MSERNYSGELPKFLFGVFTGGLLALRLSEMRPDFFSGVIAVQPIIGQHNIMPEKQI
jgi:alpha-beta hydrolase superfamily lysophospholipase